MEKASVIIKGLLLQRLREDSAFLEEPNEVFWNNFSAIFLDYEKDSKPVIAALYRLELDDPERIFEELPQIYGDFIEELAEEYVRGNKSEATERLHQDGNKLFLEKVSFFRELKNVATRLERNRMIEEIPASYASLTGAIPDEAIQAAIKKKGREDLKAKFRALEEEMKLDEVTEFSSTSDNISYNKRFKNEREEFTLSETSRSKTKTIPTQRSYKWLYAAAAVLLIGFFIWQPTQQSSSELFNSYAGSPEVLSEIDFGELGELENAVATRGGEFKLSGYTQDESERAMEAISLFQRQEFSRAKELLKGLNPRDKNEKLLFFLAVSQLNSGEINIGVQELEYLNGLEEYVYSEDVQFNLALGYLEQGKTSNSRKMLRELEASSGKYSRQADEILNDMRWF